MKFRTLTLGALGLGSFVLLWGFLAAGPMRDTPLPLPGAVLNAGVDALSSNNFWSAFGLTIWMAVRGLLAASVVGVLLGIILGYFKLAGQAFSGIIEFLKPIPPIVIMPLAILVLGPTQAMGEFLIFYGCLLPILYQSINGVRETDPIALDTSKSFGLGRWETLGRVVLPSASAFIATAIRVAVPISLIVAVVTGLLGGGPGLGSQINRALMANSVDELYALVILLGIVGLLAQVISVRIERNVLAWHPSVRNFQG